MPVLATVVSNVLMVALGAGRHMPAERLGSASLYRRHYLELAEADMPRVGPSICGTMVPKDVCDLQPWARQPPGPLLQSPPDGVILQLLQHLVGFIIESLSFLVS